METTAVTAIETTKKAPAGNHPRAARANAVSGCALTAALAAMGGRWKLFLLYRLSEGPMHFAALRRSLPEMSAKVLAQQLREMQAEMGWWTADRAAGAVAGDLCADGARGVAAAGGRGASFP